MVEPNLMGDAQLLKGTGNNSSSSSDSEIDKYIMLHSASENRLFGRQKPLHLVLGGGKSADIILWRNKQISGSIFAAITVLWFLFECVGYHLLTFVCHSLILSLATLFLWSNLASFVNVPAPEFPKVTLPEDLFVTLLLSLRSGVSCAITAFHDVAAGKDVKKFLKVIVALWVLSVVGSWFSFLTLFYLVYVILHTAPVLYEKNEDNVDAYADKAWIEVKKQYAMLDENVLQKLPMFASQKDLKRH